MSSFTKKVLQAWVTLGEGDFGADTGNTVIFSGLRMSAEIEKGGHPSKNKAKIKIYGALRSQMNAVMPKTHKPLAIRKNLLAIFAGDEGAKPDLVFRGEITNSHQSYQSPPNLDFVIEAASGYYHAIAPATPKSYQGSTSVAEMLGTLAHDMGLTLENMNVDVHLASPYLSGSAYQQAAQVADAADIEFGVDDGVMFITPRGQVRSGTVPLISKDTGMKEYPIYDSKGLKLLTLFNPAIQLGGAIKVVSQVENATGVWRVHGLKHHLECEHPGGAWLSNVQASYIGDPS
jgi:hypothetical protein